jgi:hypothetical protein
MADRIVQIADGLWNIRGSFKIAGVIDIGTQASLVRLKSGSFVLLDAYTLKGDVAAEVLRLTDQGKAVEAILNLHPFHTVHVRAAAGMFPGAKLYGTRRHQEKAPDLPWQPLHTDDPELHQAFSSDLEFTVPRGVDFISPNEKLHFSSVLAFHDASRTLHVDDTLIWNPLPLVGGLSFHPTLKSVLLRHPEATSEFRAWARELADRCESVDHLCTAHARPMPPASSMGTSVAELVRQALAGVEKILAAHERRLEGGG